MRALWILALLTGCSFDGLGGSALHNRSSEEEGIEPPMSLGGSEEDDSDALPPGQLTAGEWRDLDNWDFWRDLLESSNGSWGAMEDGWGFDTQGRVPVWVHASGDPVMDLEVQLINADSQVLWTARTDNEGRAELFAPAHFDEALWVEVDQGHFVSASVQVETDSDAPVEVEVAPLGSPDPILDLMFVIDTTGSMSDELSYLQSELADVVRVVSQREGVDVRLSVNFYRDEGEDYTVRSFPFTEDLTEAQNQLSAQAAAGGGDYPEALGLALDDAVYNHAWSPSARARLLFPVLDAPPHQTQSNIASLQQVIESAAQDGIRILPISGSGVDSSTEVLLRSMDIMTGGTYIFLTDDSGIGNLHADPTVGDYQVEYLNALLVRLITKALE